MTNTGTGKPEPMLGIAITTMNRAKTLNDLLKCLSEYTSSNHFVVVCDDGSSDETPDVAARAGVTHVRGKRRGVAWNKNRGIFYLLNATSASHILLMDDDVIPSKRGWDEEWIRSIDQFGHINYAHPTLDGQLLGSRVLDSFHPGVSKMLSGVCLGFSRQVIIQIGYMDNRFGLYGHEHVEFSKRALRAGYGGFFSGDPFFFVIRGSIDTLDTLSNGTKADIELSTLHLDKSINSYYLLPWHDEGERQVFLQEVSGAEVKHMQFWESDILRYLARYPDVGQTLEGGVAHWLQYGQYEGRKWGAS